MMRKKILAPSSWQPLNGQGLLRVPGLRIRKEKVEKQMLRRDCMRKWHVNAAWQTKMNWCQYWETSMAMLGNERKDLKVYMEGME